MPAYLDNFGYSLAVIWPLLAMALIVSSLVAVAARGLNLSNNVSQVTVVAAVVAFSFLGAVTGFLTGLSRSPVVGAVLPSVLSLAAGLAIYLVSDGNDKRGIVAASLVAFMVPLLTASLWGAEERAAHERFVAGQSAYKSDPEYLKVQALFEAGVRHHRESLGLPPEPPLTPWPRPK